MNRVRVAFLFLLLMGLLEIRASLYPNFYPPGFAVAQVDEESAELLRKIPFFAKTEMKRIKVSVVVDKVDGLNLKAVSPSGVNLGGYAYPSDVSIDGIGDLFRIYLKDSIEINGIKVCGQLGQHAQTLEIFEIKLCEDLKLPEGIIPAGSVIDFPKEVPKKGIKFSDIRCLRLAKATTLKGRQVKSGVEITPNYEVWEDPDRGCMRGAD